MESRAWAEVTGDDEASGTCRHRQREAMLSPWNCGTGREETAEEGARARDTWGTQLWPVPPLGAAGQSEAWPGKYKRGS